MSKITVIVFLLFSALTGISQVSEDSLFFQKRYKPDLKYSIKTVEGRSYTGYIVKETRDSITVETDTKKEQVVLAKNLIARVSLQKTNRVPAKEPMGENPHALNYLLLNSAMLFEEGKARTNSHWLLLESIDYAFTENWGLCLNTIAFYPTTLGVKCAYQMGDAGYVGGHVFGIANITSNNSSSAFWGYGALAKYTRGNSNKNFTIAGGLLGINSDFFYTSTSAPFINTAFVSAAYCNRFRERVAFNLEGWFLPSINAGIAGFGFKFVGNEYICWTLGCYGLMNTYDSSLKLNLKTLPIPYFGVARRFN